MRVVWFILYENLSQKLNLTRNMTRLFTATLLYIGICHRVLGQIFSAQLFKLAFYILIGISLE